MIYLLHYLDRHPNGHRPFHYMGKVDRDEDLEPRLAAHRAGKGKARFTEEMARLGIDFKLARTWPGTRARERQLKQHSGRRQCPECGVKPRNTRPGTAVR